MASTSLAKQLQKLSAPQTSILSLGHKKTSLLIQPQDIGNHDLSSFFEVGLKGLDELCGINIKFMKFKSTLFSHLWQTKQRAILNLSENQKIDSLIEEFLCLLSPYFNSKPALYALEWLVHRYNIEQYNTDILLGYALPYVSTQVFTRLIQVIPLKNNPEVAKNWWWLTRSRKTGVQINEQSFIAEAINDTRLLKLICSIIIKVIDEHKANEELVTVWTNFYAKLLVAAFTSSSISKNNLITIFLPSIVAGLESDTRPFTVSSLIVIGVMSKYITYTEKLRSSLVKKILMVKHEQLYYNCTLLLSVIFKSTRNSSNVKIPNSCIKYMAEHSNLQIEAFKKLLKCDKSIFYLLTVRDTIMLSKKEKSICSFASDLINLIDLNEDDFYTIELVKLIIDSSNNEPRYLEIVKSVKNKYKTAWKNSIKLLHDSPSVEKNKSISTLKIDDVTSYDDEKMEVDVIIEEPKNNKMEIDDSIFTKQYSSDEERIQVYCENLWIGNIKITQICNSLNSLINKNVLFLVSLTPGNIVIPTLLCCLASDAQHIRKTTITFLKKLNRTYKDTSSSSYMWLIKNIISKRQNILVDGDQIRLILMIALQSDNIDAKNTLEMLFKTACNFDISSALRLKIFDVFSALNSSNVCLSVMTHGLELLQKTQIDIAESHIFKLALNKLHPSVIDWVSIWPICEKYLKETTPVLNFGTGKLICPVTIFVQSLTTEMFNTMSDDLKLKLIKTLLDLQAKVEDNDIIDSIKSFIHEVSFDSIMFISHLEKMYDDSPNSVLWKNGIALLELIQNKNSLENVTRLTPVLFHILKKCLEFEDQSSLLEYTKQLCLSCILNCCTMTKNETEKSKVSEHLNLELIVSTMRLSPNQQTQHHALILLSNCAQMVPDQIILHVMTIFTFMGNSVMRQDDEYTFKITCQVLNTIIPILIKEGQVVTRKALSVFARSILDIPEHRRGTLLRYLVQALNTNSYLWELIVLVHKEYISGTIGTKNKVSSNTICLDICAECPINVLLDMCNNILNYCKFIELKKGESDQETLIDISNYSVNKLHKLKYCLVSFITNLLSSYIFVSKVMYCTSNDTLKKGFTEIIKNTLWFVQRQSSCSKNFMPIKYYSILDKVNALLPLDIFVDAINYILTFVDLKSTQHRTMDLLNKRLLESKSLTQYQTLKLLEPLSEIVNMSSFNTKEDLNVKQTALISITLVTKCSNINENVDVFKEILQKVTKSVQDVSVGPLLGTFVLCIAELVSNLKTKAISSFASIIPTVISVLHKLNDISVMSDGALLPSILTGLLRIISELKNFLSPYLVPLIYELSLLSATCDDSSKDENDNYKSIIRTKFQQLGEKLSEIPGRILEPVLSNTLVEIVRNLKFTAFQYVLNIAKNSFKNSMTEEFTTFLLKSLDFCCFTHESENIKSSMVEGSVISAISEVALKCSESTFRTFYHKLNEWKNGKNNELRVLIFFKLLNTLSSELKGLYLLFAGNLIPTANLILTQCKSNTKIEKTLLIQSIVSTLSNVFKYDTINFTTKDRFEIIMNPLVDILEAIELEDYNNICKNYVIPCISNLIAAVTDDTLWKDINCQIMLKARHRLPEVRSICIDTTLAVAERLGENFLPLLPDSIPFLAELMEDEQEDIEQKTRKAIQQMEKYVNEPIESYFC
ncbi:HEAT repeat-containing protein 1 [Acyrthosiphon pisum]|uniref:HEAT repeat-containing protein 1 n=1 Tax=Acyrthosiphon pisum TaxID=7029 RepID=A0A8R2AEL1_ACYPI|nr:HEAT repeat-containing protein 1 [Acyrthosiphon pisum]XP_003245839.1 HEAT repeat-containing protein 1 [Acyrthosiphon pisum]|eukprot:XP_001952627.2 PREDICTED: HEAT repeat-containing protein 1 [Acyrthosiphon pisum]